MRKATALLLVPVLLALTGCISAGGSDFPINPPGGRSYWVGFAVQSGELQGIDGNFVNIEIDSHGSNGPAVGSHMPYEMVSYKMPAAGYEFPITIFADYHGTVFIDATMTYAGLPRGSAGDRVKCYIRDATHTTLDVDVLVLARRGTPVAVHCTASITV